MQGETSFYAEMKKRWGIRWGAQVYPLINNTKSNLTSRERGVLKGRNRYCRFKGSKKQYFIFFREKKTMTALHSIKTKLTSESLNTPTLS